MTSVLETQEPSVDDLLLSLPAENDWEILGRALGMDAKKVKAKYRDALDEYIKAPKRIQLDEVKARALSNTFDSGRGSPNFDFNKSYNLSIIPGVLAVKVDVGLQILPDDWYGKVVVSATVFGKEVGTSEVKISALQSYFEIHPSVLLAKADLKIGLYGPKLCFGIEGQACYWAFGWKCQQFNEQKLFCVR